MVKRVFLLFCVLLFSSTGVNSQSLPFDLIVPGTDGIRYDEAIPEPEDILGHRIGTRHTRPDQVVEYFRKVGDISDRVVVESHGYTYEGRPLIHAIITSPANQSRMEEVRRANLQISDTPDLLSDSALRALPAIIYMGYSVHGNEASGTEAATLLLYHLAAGIGPKVTGTLDSLVIIIDPMLNPDGRDRFVDWVNGNRGAVPVADPQDRGHNELWPGGRTNHYWFDLNRDWLPVQHPESEGRLEIFHQWRPQLVTDHHEMGSDATFFFQPGVPNRTNPNTPLLNQELTAGIATYHARALDSIGSLYFTREAFDDFYYGKGSTYPDINGSLGILFEQASSRGFIRQTGHGTLTYAATIRNQFVTSLSTIEAAVQLREALLRYQRDFYLEAASIARENPIKAYVISLEGDRTRTQIFAQLLRKHRIRVHELADDFVTGEKSYAKGQALVIPVDQIQTRLLQTMMERVVEFKDSLFYDVSTWTLPLAFNLDYAEVRTEQKALLGPEIGNPRPDGGIVYDSPAKYAYLLKWDRYYAPRATYKLLEAGHQVVLSKKPFTVQFKGNPLRFPEGTIIIPVYRDGSMQETLHSLIDKIAREDHVEIYGLNTGLNLEGPDLGSATGAYLVKPEVAILTGRGMSASASGEAWHLLSERFGMAVSLLDTDALSGIDLNKYNTIVLTGSADDRIPSEDLKDWIRGGGRLIALSPAIRWVINQKIFELEEKTVELDSLYRELPYNRLDQARDAQRISGSILRSNLDSTHPISFGLNSSIPVFHAGNTFYRKSEEPGTNVAIYSEDPLLSGYVSAERKNTISESASVVAKQYGKGHVVAFLDEPNFRAFWYGTNRLFLNAILFGGSF